ncbi:DUF423 domain-containing protein [Prosthecobacter sp.]|uniref:DUF423 domain-containing protein n=1 Tax=Prosthecobacter sp. TaxID=1965333 RepID=UPI003783056B
MQPDPLRLRISALMGFLSIVLGASGAHGPVHDKLVGIGKIANWETAVQYHLPHAVVLLLLALLAGTRPLMIWAWRLFFAGILLFSGSLYLLAYTGITKLGAITPFGGLSLMTGWVLIAMSAKGKQPA